MRKLFLQGIGMPPQNNYINIVVLILVVALGAAVRFFGDPDLIGMIAGFSGIAFPLGMLSLIIMRRKKEKDDQGNTSTDK